MSSLQDVIPDVGKYLYESNEHILSNRHHTQERSFLVFLIGILLKKDHF